MKDEKERIKQLEEALRKLVATLPDTRQMLLAREDALAILEDRKP